MRNSSYPVTRDLLNGIKYVGCVLVWLVAAIPAVHAQDLLTLDEAIQISLEQNFAIKIAQNEARIAQNNRSVGNAGFLPEVSANASRVKQIEDSKTEFTEGIPDRDINGAETINRSASVDLDWVLFDGLTMFTTYDKLKELEALGEKQARLTIENTVSQVIDAYFNIVRHKKSYEAFESNVEISRERIQIAETKLDLGSGSEYDLLQAKADLNTDRAALVRQEVLLDNSKVLLNELLNRELETEFEVPSVIDVDQQLVFSELVQKALSENLELAVERTNQRISELEVKEIRGERLPEISFNIGYGFSETESDAGFVELSQSDGLNYGITARLNIFNGFDVNRRQQNAKIQLKNQELLIEDTEQQVRADITREYKNYANSLRLVELEEENLTYSRQSLDIVLERFRLGTISSIELREVQTSLIEAENRLIQAQFEAKLAETELLRLSGYLTDSTVK